MESILFNGIEIKNIRVINRPSFMYQNTFGNMQAIPVVAPIDMIDAEELGKPERMNAAKKYSTMKELVDDFFTRFPETNEGTLKDYQEITFLGFRYQYHPKHLTYYGRLNKSYILTPIIARWIVAQDGYYQIADSDVNTFPKDYNRGTGYGFSEYEKEPDGPAIEVSEPKTDCNLKDFLIPFFAPLTIERTIAKANCPAEGFNALDALLSDQDSSVAVTWNKLGAACPYIGEISVLDGTMYVVAVYASQEPFKSREGTPLPSVFRGHNVNIYWFNMAKTRAEAEAEFYITED